MLLRIAALAALVFLAAPAPPACACSCASDPMTHITLAVRGEVTAVELRDGPHGARFGTATIAVSDVLRGPDSLEIARVRFQVADGMNCGVYFRTGERGFFTAAGGENNYTASMCSTLREDLYLDRTRP